MNAHFLKLTHVVEEVEVTEESKLDLPKKYVVWLHNDDYTPMEFVVELLKRFFFFDESLSVKLMLQVHRTGKAQCGVFTRDIAETMVVLITEYARQHEHPLLCTMEQSAS